MENQWEVQELDWTPLQPPHKRKWPFYAPLFFALVLVGGWLMLV
jgi:hypothetical protein